MAQNSARNPGRHFLQIPGPTPLPDRLLRAMDTPIIDHRGPEFAKITKKALEAIKTISPQTPAILFSGKVRIYDRDTRADLFLPKGMYAPVELLERIRLLLVRKRGPHRAQSKAQAAGEAGAA
jgi:hypothetical protein